MKKKLLVLLITAASTMMPNLVFAVAIDISCTETEPCCLEPEPEACNSVL